ncbi:uncharacterized protein MAM_02807 [Metarhizium album ARSEF 1941]|uniref:Uncharacterized protein n=1 Tax=Metarhizium album (strain ARSEF 1941) TaxID=1081103 RepID=A0A0B2WZU2_METAS|nr:uncharacterized protein MAM_02807 [Metarhizium album ARSEF 1941]KHN99109.1 hypothetical protein MAM_02807 [Metarhizium album ARSEF 1941]
MPSSARDQALLTVVETEELTPGSHISGAIVCASLGTVLFHLRGGAPSLFRGGLRLVLAAFLLFASLWAVDGFVATFLDQTSAAGCQVAVTFAAAFDQLARISLEEFLFWVMRSDVPATSGVLFPQTVFFVRFIVGGIFVGVQRPQFNPVCVGTNLLWPLGVVVLCMDALIILGLVTKASSTGVFRDTRAENPLGSRSRAIALTIVVSGLWIVLSIPMMLGVSTLSIATRTALPAIGVLLVIGVLAFYFEYATLPKKAAQNYTPCVNKLLSEAVHSPTRRPGNREVSTIQSSLPPDRLGRSREDWRKFPRSATKGALVSRDANNALPVIGRPSRGQAAAGIGGMPVKGELFPPLTTESLTSKREGCLVQPTKKAVIKGGKLVISFPMIQENGLSGASPLRRIATVDLATAAKQDRERRVNFAATQQSITPQQPSTNRYSNRPSEELRRKQVGRTPITAKQTMASTMEATEARPRQGASSAVLQAPVTSMGGIRQRSPSHISQCFHGTIPPVIPSKDVSSPRIQSPTSQISSSGVRPKPLPRSPLRPVPGKTTKAATLQGPTQSPTEISSRTKDHVQELKNTATGAPSGLTPELPSSRSESVAQRSSINCPSRNVDILVPPVPPLSPRDPASCSYDQLERALSNRHLGSEPSSSIPRSSSGKDNIRPPRRKPTTPPPVYEGNPPKTPVQLRETSGLPGHPRARTVKSSASASQDKMVMFVNSIDYSDPSGVRDIIHGMATDLATKANSRDSEKRDSVIHRPRPIPRMSPSRSSVSTRKSPSVASASDYSSPKKRERKVRLRASASIVRAQGSLSPLPPVPPLPPQQPPPGVPKSEPLVPATTKETLHQARTDDSEVKESIPPMVEAGIAQSPTTSQPRSPYGRPEPQERVNNPDTLTAWTPEEHVWPSTSAKRQLEATKYMSKFSIATTISPEDPPSLYLQSPALALLRSSQEGLRRKSSPVLPGVPANDGRKSAGPISTVTDQPGIQSAATSSAKRDPKSQDLDDDHASKSVGVFSAAVGMSSRTTFVDGALPSHRDEVKEVATFKLDRSADGSANAASTLSTPNSAEGGTDSKKDPWHCRVGETPPTFSGREAMQTRRFPKPPRLELDKAFKRIRGSPPTASPLEAPQQALNKIQEQLSKLDESDVADAGLEKRMSLLKSIEIEMGKEENRWQKMRDDLTKTSASTLSSTPNSPCPDEASPLSPQNVQPPAINVFECSPNRLKNNGMRPQSSILYTAEQVQMSRANLVLDSRRVITGDDASSIAARAEGVLRKPENSAPNPKIPNLEATPRSSTPEAAIESTRSPSPGPRLVTGKFEESSPVEELSPLDRQLESPVSQSTSPGMWRAAPQSPKSPPPSGEPAARRHTLRPPRRSRRISPLPDILENPEPLENKRDTLGIFRFPWGERSDTATPHISLQNRVFMPPGSVSRGGPPIYPTLEQQAQVIGSQQQQSSFFDHHSEEEAFEDIFEDSDNTGSDDDDDAFDETTLWEIASLLKSDRVPSRESLFPSNEPVTYDAPPRLSVVQGPANHDRPSPVPPARQVTEMEDWGFFKEEPSSPPLPRRKSLSPIFPPETTLWVYNVCMPPSPAHHGLFQDDELWETYVDSHHPVTRAPLRQNKASNITSTSLWSKRATKADMPPLTHLWPGQSQSQPIVESIVQIKEVSRPSVPVPQPLWSAPKSIPGNGALGLPQPEPEHWNQYIDLGGRVLCPRLQNKEHLAIESSSLWSQTQGASQEEQSGVATASPTPPSDGNKGGTSPTATITTGEQVAGNDMTFPIETSINSPESEHATVSTDGQPIDDACNAVESPDDVATPSLQVRRLWVPVSVPPLDEEHQGLFQVQQGGYQHDRKYRRTSKSPAALGTRPTPRLSHPSLQELESNALWAPASPHTFARDWFTLPSVRPSTEPDRLSRESSSGSPVSNTSSVCSDATAESAVASLLIGQASAQLKPRQSVAAADCMATLEETGPPARPRTEIARSVPNRAAALHDTPQGAVEASTTSSSQPDQEAQQDTDTTGQEERLAVTEVNADAETVVVPEQHTNPPAAANNHE